MPAKASRPDAPARDERVMVFIDGSNLYHVLSQNCGRYDLVFSRFVTKLADGRDLRRTYYYNIRQNPSFNPQATAEQQKFLASLYEVPYLEVRLGVHRKQGDTMVEKGVDVMMATDLVVAAHRDLYDTAIVVSGDGDFYPAIQAAKDLGKHVEVAAFDSNLSPEAKRAADVPLIFTKSYFTGLWTDRRRTGKARTAAPADQGTSRRKTPAPAAEKAEAAAETPRPQPSRSTPRRRKAAPSTGSNGAQPDPGASGADGGDSGDERGVARTSRRRRLVSVTGTTGAAEQPREPAPKTQAEAKAAPAEAADTPGRRQRGSRTAPAGDDSAPARRRSGWWRRRLGSREQEPSQDSGRGGQDADSADAE